MQPSPIPETLIAAYRATDYISRVNDVDEVLKIGEPAVWLARLFDAHRVSTAFFITADNPFSKVRSTAENAQAQERLREDLLDQTDLIFEGWGVGADRDWPPEKSFLALGLSLETARSLGARFQQNAVVWIGLDLTPQLILLVCKVGSPPAVSGSAPQASDALKAS